MAPVTIGVPVYNGVDHLDECLACLARQTFRDINVLILDNASTDATPDIARAWAARDARFCYARQPRNVGMMPNFRDVLLRAESRWFMWRSHDDYTADNYIEALHRLATSERGCALAVPTVVALNLDGGRRPTPPPDPETFVALRGQLRLLLDHPGGWFYGLWDAETARKSCLPVYANYPFATASEYLTLYGPIMDGAVRGTPDTEIFKRVRRTATIQAPKIRFSTGELLEMRRTFVRELRRVRSERDMPLGSRVAHALFEPFYLRRRLPSLSKIARTWARDLVGTSKPPSTPRPA